MSANNISTAAALAPSPRSQTSRSWTSRETISRAATRLSTSSRACRPARSLPQHNPIQKTEYYRRRLVSGCRRLTYLDDTPVETAERVGCEAWAASGGSFDAERTARRKLVEDGRRAAKRRRNGWQPNAPRAAPPRTSARTTAAGGCSARRRWRPCRGLLQTRGGGGGALAGTSARCARRVEAGERAIAATVRARVPPRVSTPVAHESERDVPGLQSGGGDPLTAAIAAATDKRRDKTWGRRGKPGLVATEDYGDIVDDHAEERAVDQLLPAVELRLQQHDQPELGDAGEAPSFRGGRPGPRKKTASTTRLRTRCGARYERSSGSGSRSHIVRAEKVGG